MRAKPRYKLKDDEIRRLALRFIKSSFIDSGEIKSVSPTEPDDGEKTGSSPINLHDVLDDLELKTTNLLRAERGWRRKKLVLTAASKLSRQLTHAQPNDIIP